MDGVIKKKSGISAKKILLVDDEPETLALYSQALKAAGYMVIESGDGAQAMFKIRNSNFDLIITDINMPRLTGDQMLSSLLARKSAQFDRPVIISSGYIDRELVEKFKRQRHIGFLTKPASVENLLKLVKKLLGE